MGFTPLLGQELVAIALAEVLGLGKHGSGMKKGNFGVRITLEDEAEMI